MDLELREDLEHLHHPQQASQIMKRGCDGFIQKPFSLEQISKKIREILDK